MTRMNRLESHTHLFKALSEPLRLRTLLLLHRAGELCVCDLVEILKRSQSTISRHLANLKHAGWVASRRQGVWIHYRLQEDPQAERLQIIRLVSDQLEGDAVIQEDRRRLERKQASGCKTGRCG